jgi:hypothetical protein
MEGVTDPVHPTHPSTPMPVLTQSSHNRGSHTLSHFTILLSYFASALSYFMVFVSHFATMLNFFVIFVSHFVIMLNHFCDFVSHLWFLQSFVISSVICDFVWPFVILLSHFVILLSHFVIFLSYFVILLNHFAKSYVILLSHSFRNSFCSVICDLAQSFLGFA